MVTVKVTGEMGMELASDRVGVEAFDKDDRVVQTATALGMGLE